MFTLHMARQHEDVEVVGLLTTLDADTGRVTTHAVRRELLQAQADRLELPVHIVELPSPCPNHAYEARMAEATAAARSQRVDHIIFGDLSLPDVRAYREQVLSGSGITALFPLWDRRTRPLAQHVLDSGLRAVLSCVDPARLSADFAGRSYDPQLITDLPAGVDPCGEHGEFHTFVCDGPGFRAPIDVTAGDLIKRGRLVTCDLRESGHGDETFS